MVRRVNIIPAEELATAWPDKRVIAVLAVAIFILCSVTVFIVQKSQISGRNEKVQKLRRVLADLPAIDPGEGISLRDKIPWTVVLKEISLAKPEGVWLTKMLSSVAAKSKSVALHGNAESKEAVIDFVNQLEAAKNLRNLRFKLLEKSEEFSQDVYRFEVECEIGHGR